jgi:octaprenyl-diphosphate synthase
MIAPLKTANVWFFIREYNRLLTPELSREISPGTNAGCRVRLSVEKFAQAMATFTATSPSNNQFPFDLVRPDLEKVEIAIRAQVRDFDSAVEPYIAYICNTSGKRIRPALAILVGGAAGGVGEDHRKIGVILELIHMATLVHDDIIDGATARRSMPTANSKWGNALAVLLGDALFSHALTLATDFNSIEICRKVGNAAREVCQGEIIQTQRRFDLTLSKEDYFRVIEMKTGALFAAATGLAAAVSGLSKDDEAALAAYGMKLGTAYQIYDDCLDLVGSEEVVGKTLGTDLAKGKLTLPILNLLESASESQRGIITCRILEQQELDLPVLVGIAEYEGAIERAVDTALGLVAGCREDLEVLAPSEYRDALTQITRFLETLLRKCLN